jgi:hypothetical protein
MNTGTHDWTLDLLSTIVPFLIFYAIGFIILFFVVRFAVKSGIRAGNAEQTKQNIIISRLIAEQLKNQGISENKIDDILAGK